MKPWKLILAITSSMLIPALGALILLACNEVRTPGPVDAFACKEKVKVMTPNNYWMECDDRQVAEIIDRPIPGAQHAQWVVRCACPKPANPPP
jgi:hypothetical protein